MPRPDGTGTTSTAFTAPGATMGGKKPVATVSITVNGVLIEMRRPTKGKPLAEVISIGGRPAPKGALYDPGSKSVKVGLGKRLSFEDGKVFETRKATKTESLNRYGQDPGTRETIRTEWGSAPTKPVKATPGKPASAADVRRAEGMGKAAATKPAAKPVASRDDTGRTPPGDVTMESFLAGLRRHESGGRYDAQNSTSTASGAYQYLDSTWNNYKGYARAKDAPPAVQDERAALDSQAALTRYGGDWEKVAAAHFRGAGWVAKNPDKSTWGSATTPGVNPTVGKFVASVLGGATGGGVGRSMAVAGGPSGTGAAGGYGVTSGTTGGALGPDGKPDPKAAIAEYDFIAALAKDVPDIQRALTTAIANGYDNKRFLADVRETAWWKKHQDSDRRNSILKATNPAEYNRRLQQQADAIVILSRNLGVPQDNAKIKTLAERALRFGWSDSEVKRYVAASIQVKATGNTGATAVTVDALKQQAKQYLVPISDATMQQWTSQILKGDVPAEAFESYLKEQAKSLWPTLGNALDSGVTVAQYVEPYRQLAAQTLEINPDDVDFMSPKWSLALFQLNKDGSRGAMSLADWGQSLRRRPEYGKTRQANEQAASLTSAMLRTFGKLV